MTCGKCFSFNLWWMWCSMVLMLTEDALNCKSWKPTQCDVVSDWFWCLSTELSWSAPCIQGAELGGWHGLPAAQSSTFYQIIGISLQSQNHHGTGSLEKLYLRWNDFESNLSGMFRELIIAKDFFNVTLACDDDQKQAHKVILSACSPFIRNHLESQQTWASSAVPERRIVCWPGVCT